jgi:hypothetical protein
MRKAVPWVDNVDCGGEQCTIDLELEKFNSIRRENVKVTPAYKNKYLPFVEQYFGTDDPVQLVLKAWKARIIPVWCEEEQIIYLVDSNTGKTMKRVATTVDAELRLAVVRATRRRQAIDFDTKKELENYLEEHPDADKSLHHVKPKEEQIPVTDIVGPMGQPPSAVPEEGKKKPGKESQPVPKQPAQPVPPQPAQPQAVQPQPQPVQQPPQQQPQSGRKVPALKDKPKKKPSLQMMKLQKGYKPEEQANLMREEIGKMGIPDSDSWDTHKLNPVQLSPQTVIKFPDGSEKKYGQLDDNTKKQLTDAMERGEVAHKGMSDYADVKGKPPAEVHKTYIKNVQTTLDTIADDDVKEEKNKEKSKVSKANIKDFIKQTKGTTGSVLKRYDKILSKHTNKMVNNHVDDVLNSIQEGLNDGSFEGVSQTDLDEYIREDLKRMLHQEAETKRRSLGDHGIRHATANARNSLSMLDQLQKSGVKVTGKDKFMALSIQANHDIGYTLGKAATEARSGNEHKDNSAVVVGAEEDRYNHIFGEGSAAKFKEIVRTHDEPKLDWENDPLASSVRLADNLALFGQDKVQDLFIKSPKAMKLACKLRMAVDAKDEGLQKEITSQLHDHLDSDNDIVDSDKELLHKSIDETSKMMDYTTKDILSRYSGRLKGFAFDKNKNTMNVDMKYSPEGHTVDMLFGDAVSANKFKGFAKDMGGGKAIEGTKGSTIFGEQGKSRVQLNIDGIDDEPIDSATNEGMKDFITNTARASFQQASKIIQESGSDTKAGIEEIKKKLEIEKKKFTDEEWKQLWEVIDGEATNPEAIIKKLGAWPLLASEKKWLMNKEASLCRRGSLKYQKIYTARRGSQPIQIILAEDAGTVMIFDLPIPVVNLTREQIKQKTREIVENKDEKTASENFNEDDGIEITLDYLQNNKHMHKNLRWFINGNNLNIKWWDSDFVITFTDDKLGVGTDFISRNNKAFADMEEYFTDAFNNAVFLNKQQLMKSLDYAFSALENSNLE